MGAHLSQDESGDMTLEAKDRLFEVQSINEDCISKTRGDHGAIPSELMAYRSLIEKLINSG